MRLKEKVKKENNPEKAYNYLVKEKGMAPHIASGLVGNLMQESYMLTKVWKEGRVDDVGSMGIMQWHGDRLNNLYNFYKEQNPDYKKGEKIPLKSQLDFIVYESNNAGPWLQKQYDKAFEAETVEQASLYFSDYVIRPHKDYAHNDKRVAYANKLFANKNPKKDNAIYGMNNKGQIVTINPEKATEEELKTSDIYKSMYNANNLTSLNKEEKSTTLAPEWKLKLQQKINERKKVVGFIQQGGIDYVAPQRKPVNTVQRIQQSYMENGGQIPVSSNGLKDFPNSMVMVPVTNGKVTMKDIPYAVLGIADTGEQILMQPDQEYEFKGAKTVLEIPQTNDKFQDGGERLQRDKPAAPKEYFLNYLRSPKFLERRYNSGDNRPKETAIKRMGRIQETKVTEQENNLNLLERLKYKITEAPFSNEGSKYLAKENSIVYDENQAKELRTTKGEIMAHEYGHAAVDNNKDYVSNLNAFEIANIKARLTDNKTMTKHDLEPEEVKADLDALRYLFYKKGIYNSGKEDFNVELLDQIEDDNFIKKRLLKNVKSKKDLQWLMNNIAFNNNSKNKALA